MLASLLPSGLPRWRMGSTPHRPSLAERLKNALSDSSHVNYASLSSAMTDVGLTRQLNEDNWGWRKLSKRAVLYAVADGGRNMAVEVSHLAETICGGYVTWRLRHRRRQMQSQ